MPKKLIPHHLKTKNLLQSVGLRQRLLNSSPAGVRGRRGEIQSLQWQQIDFLNRALTVGDTKTEAGTGRVIPLNERALMTLQTWATSFPDRKPQHFVFPSEHYGLAGNERKPHAKTIDPDTPAGELKSAWESAKEHARVQCRFHDLRHTACTRLLERGASFPVVASIMGWSASTTAKMAKTYGHIGSDVQRTAVETLERTPKSATAEADTAVAVESTDSEPNS